MGRGALVAIWLLAGLGFLTSLGLAYYAWSWAWWGAGGALRSMNVPFFSWVVFASPLASLVVALRAFQTRSLSAGAPIFITSSAPLLLLLGKLAG